MKDILWIFIRNSYISLIRNSVTRSLIILMSNEILRILFLGILMFEASDFYTKITKYRL